MISEIKHYECTECDYQNSGVNCIPKCKNKNHKSMRLKEIKK